MEIIAIIDYALFTEIKKRNLFKATAETSARIIFVIAQGYE